MAQTAKGQATKADVDHLYQTIIGFLSLAILGIWALYNELIPVRFTQDEYGTFLPKLQTAITYITGYKVFFSIATLYSFWLMPSKVKNKREPEEKKKWLFYVGVSGILFWIPFLGIEAVDLYLYIILWAIHFYCIFILSLFYRKGIEEDADIFGISKEKEDELSIRIGCVDADNGSKKPEHLIIHKTTQGIRLNAGPGGGKTILLQHFIRQFMQKGFCGVMYDFEGDIREYDINNSENPLVNTRTAYTYLKEAWKNRNDEGLSEFFLFEDKGKAIPNITSSMSSDKKVKILARELKRVGLDVLERQLEQWELYQQGNRFYLEKPDTIGITERYIVEQSNSLGGAKKKYFYQGPPVKFALINFVSPEHSVRVNPLNKKYHTNLISLRSVVTLFLKAVDLELVKKTDFWAKNGISYTQAIAIRLYKDYPEQLTIPHVISFLLTPYKQVLDWLAEDPETKKQAATIMTSYYADAESQLAGSTASGQSPVQPLYDPDIYWILSPTAEEEFDLDITNPKNPYLLSVGNAPEYSNTFSPIISLILNVAMMNMNKLGKRKSIWFADEFATITMNPDEFAKFPATARKKKVVVMTATQSDKQEDDKYGKDKSAIIRDNMSTQFQGKTPSDDTAKRWSASLGKVKRKNESISNSTDSQSTSESLQQEDVIQPRDVQGQKVGHFLGQIADGNPPYFSLQFDYFDQNQITDEIPVMNNSLDEFEMDEKAKQQTWRNLIDLNFTRIENEVKDILATVTPREEKEED